jgi:hypothetical protein
VLTVIAFVLCCSLGIFRLRVDTNHINFFSRNHPLGQSARHRQASWRASTAIS